MASGKILIVSDHPRLARAIEQNLQSRWPVTGLVLENFVARQPPAGAWALIIVSLSSQVGEPLVALQRAGLTHFIEQVPILIVSERAFDAAPHDLIQHLDYPFTPETLGRAVERLMATSVAPEGGTAVGGALSQERPLAGVCEVTPLTLDQGDKA